MPDQRAIEHPLIVLFYFPISCGQVVANIVNKLHKNKRHEHEDTFAEFTEVNS